MSELEQVNAQLYRSDFPIDNADLYVTTACNLHCRDCMAGDLRNRGEYHAETRFVLETLDKLKGIKSVHIAGQGEPFCHPDIIQILDYAGRIVGSEVRVNTNATYMPLEDSSAESFIASLPEKLSVFISLDRFHDTQDPHAKKRVDKFKKYCGAYDIPLTFSLRVFDKKGEAQEIVEHYKLKRRPTVVNRVLRMGWAKHMREARYVDLTKLFNRLTNNRGYGILPDGTVVADFVPAYFTEDTRPAISVVGNVKDESLISMFARRKVWEKKAEKKSSEHLASMIDDMGSHPFCISNWREYSFDSPPLKEFFDEAESGTAKVLGDKIFKVSLTRTREVVSENGLVHYGYEELPGKEDDLNWGFWKTLYKDEFTENDKGNVLQLQRLWNVGDFGYGESFWRTLIEMRGQRIDGGDAFREFVKIFADTEEKRKIVGYLNSQNNLLSRGRNMPRILRFLRSYALWPYNFGKSEKRDKILHDVATEIGYEGRFMIDIPLGRGSIALTALAGFMEGMLSSIPLGIDSWSKVFVPAFAFSVFRGLSFHAGYNYKFRGKVKL